MIHSFEVRIWNKERQGVCQAGYTAVNTRGSSSLELNSPMTEIPSIPEMPVTSLGMKIMYLFRVLS